MKANLVRIDTGETELVNVPSAITLTEGKQADDSYTLVARKSKYSESNWKDALQSWAYRMGYDPEDIKLDEAFYGHAGRKGKVGGSVARKAGSVGGITRDDVKSMMVSGSIENVRSLASKGDRLGYSGTYVVSIRKNGETIDAVFKPTNEENPVNIAQVGGKQTKREVATSEVAEVLGLGDYVPVATIRKIKSSEMGRGGGKGALIEYMNEGLKVGANRELRNSKSFDFNFDSFHKNKTLVGKFSAFDYVIGARDRHAENWKTDGKRFALIDNGQTFRQKRTITLRSNFMVYAKSNKLSIKDAIGDDWDNAWPSIKKIMQKNKIGGKGQRYTKERYDELIRVKNSGGTFADLSIKAKN